VKFFLTALICIYFWYPPQVLAYPQVEPKMELVTVSPNEIVSCNLKGQNGVGKGRGSSREFITIGQSYRIRQTGIISKIRLYGQGFGLKGLYIKFWRQNGSNFDLVGTSENIAKKLKREDFYTIYLQKPISVQEGDYYGFRLEGSEEENYLCGSYNRNYTKTYFTADLIPTSNYDWLSNQREPLVVPMEFYMKAPQFVFMGDSIIAGYPINNNYIENKKITDDTSTIESQFGVLTGYSFQNMGITGESTYQIYSRFFRDVVSLKPKVVVLEGGINDITDHVSTQEIINNWTLMLNMSKANSIAVIALKVLPGKTGSGELIQELNDALVKLIAKYPNAIIIDTSKYIGQFRPDGPPDNLWGLKDEYTVDGTHLNKAGNLQIVLAIIDSLEKLPYAMHEAKKSTDYIKSILTFIPPSFILSDIHEQNAEKNILSRIFHPDWLWKSTDSF